MGGVQIEGVKMIKIFKQRGFFHQCTNEEGLDNLFLNEKVTAYIGFDCTASSLHVGSLLQIMVLRLLKKLGHKPIILLGGATTKIGDPSGKDKSRPAITNETIAQNLIGIRKVFEKFGLGSVQIVNNEDWISRISYQDMLYKYGKYFSVNRMLAFDSVKNRLKREEHLNFLEFNYVVLQAYDFVYLSKEYGCRLQIGGSDQWGNIVSGVDLYKATREKKESHNCGEIFGLTTPLITTSSGAKMGKTADGAVWLSADKFSSYDYWQFWRNTDDKDVGRFLRLFTDLTIEEIEELEKLEGAEINKAKIILANEATRICHGEKAAMRAEQEANNIYNKRTK